MSPRESFLVRRRACVVRAMFDPKLPVFNEEKSMMDPILPVQHFIYIQFHWRHVLRELFQFLHCIQAMLSSGENTKKEEVRTVTL